MLLFSKKSYVISCFISLAVQICNCKFYYVSSVFTSHGGLNDACTAPPLNANAKVAKQCDPDNLVDLTNQGTILDSHIWVFNDDSCKKPGPPMCPAVRVSSSSDMVCRPCSESYPVWCESNSDIPGIAGTLVTSNNIDQTCSINWVRKGRNEFLVVMTKMTHRDATLHCVVAHGGAGLLSDVNMDTGFLSLPQQVSGFWISIPVMVRADYAFKLLNDGTVIQEQIIHEAASICQRQYNPTLHPHTTTQTMSSKTMKPTTASTKMTQTMTSKTTETTTASTMMTQTMTSNTTKPTTASTMMTQTTTLKPVRNTSVACTLVGDFRREPLYDGHFSQTDALETSKVFNVMLCSRRCLKHAACHAFFFDVTSAECQLLKTVIGTQSQLETRDDTNYYVKN